MNKGLVLAALVAGAMGCTGTTPGGRQWAADPDKAPPIQTSTRAGGATPADADPAKLPPASTRVSADDIDDQNYQDSLRKLESETKVEKRALSQAK